MKIGIFTFTAANNYGAVLQAYALKEYIKSLGVNSHCVNYKPHFLEKKYKPFSKYRIFGNGNPLMRFIAELISYKKICKKNKSFEDFKTHFLSFIPKDAPLDIAVVGSDQVWNYKITNGDNVFLGDIPSANKIISYAASMEADLDKKNIESFGKKLKNYKAISVRELGLHEMLKEKYGLKNTLVVDPTFLLSKDQWIKIEETFKPNKKSYIFMYGFGFSKKENKVIDEFAIKNNLSVIRATSGIKIKGGYNNNISPQQFVHLIHNAYCVITNSFHGTAFSLIMGTPFAVIAKDLSKKNNRIESILKISGLPTKPICLSDSFNDKYLLQLNHYPPELLNAITISKNFLIDNIKS